MKVYFDRTKPFYLTNTPGFFGIEVDVSDVALANITALNALKDDMELRIRDAASPERANQELAEYFVEQVRLIFKTRKQDNASFFTRKQDNVNE